MTLRWAFYLNSVPFTRDVIGGTASLGGSESACVGLMRALARRGHLVAAFAEQLAPDAAGDDGQGVFWAHAGQLTTDYLDHHWDVFVSLRATTHLETDLSARLRLLWNQDLFTTGGLHGDLVTPFVAQTWRLDGLVYVSAYHRQQWERVAPDLTPLGWVTRNGYDPARVPDQATVTKDWRRVIHVSRPERGLFPLLAMWPALKARVPEAELRVCRYASMYDGEGSEPRRICELADRQAELVNSQVGGITWLGTLGKADLYRELSEAAVLWYPGIAEFAETSCIAAIEAQACGTPIVASSRGALPETCPHATLVTGDAWTPAYQTQSVDAVVAALHGCQDATRDYRTQQQAGRAHVDPAYTYDTLAGEWEGYALARFDARRGDGFGIARRLLREDDHVACAALVPTLPPGPDRDAIAARCARVIAGDDQRADDYAAHASADPIKEATVETRFRAVPQALGLCRRVLDVACGNGAAAVRLLTDCPDVTLVGVDYAQANIDRATEAMATLGFSDRATFVAQPVYDYATHEAHPEFLAWAQTQAPFDGAFVGEFLEHCANPAGLIAAVESCLAPGATVLLTCPRGPYSDLLSREAQRTIQRGHVHSFEIADLTAIFGQKADLAIACSHLGVTPRGDPIGVWLIRYTYQPGRPTGTRDLAHRVRVTRPAPRLSVGLITKNASADLRRCLNSVWAIADEIVVGDTGSTDDTVAIAEDFGARVLPLPAVADLRGGFAEARNAVLAACTGDWFFWIDADEVLETPQKLRLHLDAGPFRGYAVKQQHLMADMPYAPTDPRCFDTPVRLFRRDPDIQFYGCVHEQPQAGDCNTDIMPALQVHDFSVIHYGYRSETVRREKSNRNLPLILRNDEVFPDRVLNVVIKLRECVLRGTDATREGDHAKARQLYQTGIDLFLTHFADPADKHHALARPWYELALAHLGAGWEFEYSFAGMAGALNGKHAAPKRFRATSPDEVRAMVLHAIKPAEDRMRPPTIWTDPHEPTEATA